MSDFSVQVEKITGRSSGNKACGIFTKRVSVGDGDLGTLVGCILVRLAEDGESRLVKSSADVDLQSAIGDIFELSVKRLEGADEGILNALILSKNSAVEYARSKNLEVSFTLTFFFEEVCYIVRFGKDVHLLVFEAPKSVEITFESGSGPTGPGQIYLIATDAFLSIFDTADLARETDIDFREIIDGIAVEIAGEADQSEIGAAFVAITATTEKKAGDIEEDVKEFSGSVSQSISEPADQSISETENADDSDSTGTPRNLISAVFSAIFREFNKLRHGDIGAMLRLRRNIVILAILIFAILVISIVFTIRQKSVRERVIMFDGYFTNASSKLLEGEALIDLNKSRAREALVMADGQIKQALILDPENKRAQDLSLEITSKLKETEVSSNVNFETLVEVSSPLAALSASGKNLVGASEGKIFVVNASTKSLSEVSGVDGLANVAVFDNKAFLVTAEKIVRVDLLNEQSKTIVERAGTLDIDVFLGNVYLLFGDKIEKFVPVEGGYSGPADYLSAPVNFSSKSHFAIDGSIWVSSGKQIFKFTRGEKQNFEISGLVSDVFDFSLIYTNSSLSNLYVVDSVNSALLVIDKDGVYKKAYQAPEFAKAVDVVIADDESKMYVAVGDKILEAAL